MKVPRISVMALKRGKETDSGCVLEAEPKRLGVWVVEYEVGKEKRIMYVPYLQILLACPGGC